MTMGLATNTASAPVTARTHGIISSLQVRATCSEGVTRLGRCSVRAPLKIARSWPSLRSGLKGGAEVCIMDASPGILDGDVYEFDWHLEAGARMAVWTQGMTRIHPTRQPVANSKNETPRKTPFASRIITRLHLGEGSRLFWLPEAILPFAGADVSIQLQAYLEPGSTLFLLESQSVGRVARGERWQFQRLHTSTRCQDEHGPLFCSQYRLEPKNQQLESLSGWGRWNNLATLTALTSGSGQAQTLLWETSAREATMDFEGQVGLSQLARDGVAVTFLGERADLVRRAALQVVAAWEMDLH